MNGFEPIRRCVYEYTDAGNNGRVLWEQSVDDIERENNKLKKENEDLRRLATMLSKLVFETGVCPSACCSDCRVYELCGKCVYLEGLYGIDKDLAEVE